MLLDPDVNISNELRPFHFQVNYVDGASWSSVVNFWRVRKGVAHLLYENNFESNRKNIILIKNDDKLNKENGDLWKLIKGN